MSSLWLLTLSAVAAHWQNATLAETARTQAFLFQWQHPRNCSTVKWFKLNFHDGGLGSQLHVAGAALARAIDLGAIMLWNDTILATSTTKFACRNSAWDCLFAPISNCTFASVRADNQIALTWQQSHYAVPKAFVNVSSAPYPLLYWWRAQSIKYLFRPSTAALAYISQLRQRRFATAALACGMVCVHVRHGDKGTEAPVLPWYRFEPSARVAHETLVNRGMRCQREPAIFIMSDDVAMFREAIRSFGAKQVLFFNDTQLLRNGRTPPNTHTSAVAMLNVQLCLECDAFVLQRTSNLAQLIDQLRLTSGKLDAPFFEVDRYDFWWK
jgi:hypothetical protein